MWRFLSVFPLLIFLLLIFVGFVGTSEAQIEGGFNYDKEFLGFNENGDKIFKWYSHSNRLLNYYWNDKPVYVDYKIIDYNNYISYESYWYSLIFDKSTCGINEYGGGHLKEDATPKKIMSHVFKEALSSSNTWYDILDVPCSFSIIDNQITITKDDISTGKVFYNMGSSTYEWTYDYEHKDMTKTDHKYGFTFICDGPDCGSIKLDGVSLPVGSEKTKTELNNIQIQFGNSYLDLKEKQHGYTWALKKLTETRSVIDFTDAKGVIGLNEHVIVDPSFSSTDPTEDGHIRETSGNDICDDSGSYLEETTTITIDHGPADSPAGMDCGRSWMEWDLSSIPDSSTITNSSITVDVITVRNGGKTTDIYGMDSQPSASSSATIWTDFNAGTVFVDGTAAFQTTGNNIEIDLGTLADSAIETALVNDWFAIGLKAEDETVDSTDNLMLIASEESGSSAPMLTIEYTPPAPDAVTDLTTSNITFESIDLSWTKPGLNGGSLTGYQINSTTPYGDPLTILVNNTNSNSTTATVSDLTFATPYSFRVSAWTENGNNAGGNIANATTLGESFTVGQVSVNQTNPDLIDIRFQRTDVNSTSTRVDILYSNSYNLTCTIDHRFARTSQNYSNLDVVVFDSSTSNSSFFFNDHTNDLVNMYCFNENDITNDERYQITWTSFPLLDQFTNFRSGVYGTDGRIGVMDFITLTVIIFSMIGLNRINESVGVIFNIIFVGALAYFGIIELPTIIFGALTVVLIFTIASTRKK